MTSYGRRNGSGRGIGKASGGRRNANTRPCRSDGPGYGHGSGRGKGKNR